MNHTQKIIESCALYRLLDSQMHPKRLEHLPNSDALAIFMRKLKHKQAVVASINKLLCHN